MTKFATLYKRAKTGAVQYWTISVEQDPVFPVCIIKESGRLGTTSPTTHREPITQGKNIGKSNETTPLQQAYLQAESDWKKKVDEGYKSLMTLGISDHGTYVSYAGQDLSLEEMLDTVLPQFNTDASGNAKPMLAHDWKDGKKVKFPAYCQPKLDGFRCLLTVTRQGPDLNVKFYSRSGKEYTYLHHISETVLENAGSDPFILDGELYADDLTFQQIAKAIKKEGRDWVKQVHFRAYDIVTDAPQRERLQQLVEKVRELDSPYIHLVPTHEVHTVEDVRNRHNAWVAEGYEGAMVRHPEGIYAQGQRSSDLLKVKSFIDEEFNFVRWETGQRHEDLLAVLTTADGKEFTTKMMGSREIKEEYRRMTPSKVTVKFFEYTDDGIPRFPVGKAPRDSDD